jgi:hypothetical protein
MNDAASAKFDFVTGDRTGLAIPAHPAALRQAGPEFLTKAFRAFGSLNADNRVTEITRCEICPGGSTGRKLFLSLAYERPQRSLHTDLFVKFSRDFEDPARDNRGKYEMESESRLATLSRDPNFPIMVPTAYFSDYDHHSHTGLIITQRIAFGSDGIEPHRRKCLDHEIADPLPYYRAIVKSLARLAAAHRSGRLSPDIAEQFPFDADKAAAADPIVSHAAQISEYIEQYAKFATRCPQLLPAAIRTPEFIARLHREALQFLALAPKIKRFQQSNPNLIALCHWNGNIDNAWFWRDATRNLQCGLMDWGHVGQMNLAFALWGSLSAAGHDIWADHYDTLLTLFTDELAEHGGPKLSPAELKLHVNLYAAMMFLFYFVHSPATIIARLPQAASASGPHDPIFLTSDTARNQLHILTVVMNLWNKPDFFQGLERLPSAA